MSAEVSLLAAFGAGMLSFLSPCVLPLIPAYLSFMTGLSVGELAGEGRSTSKVLLPAVLFVAGFTLVFVAFGATASVLGQVLLGYRVLIERVAGFALIAFGVLMLGVIRVPWLYGEARADMGGSRRFGRWAAFVMGAAFAAGWTPCVGPMLGSILLLAGSSGSVGSGVLLLLAYSLGLGVPFILVALLLGRLGGALAWMNRHALAMNRFAGAVLVALGLLIVSGQFGVLGTWLTSVLPGISI